MARLHPVALLITFTLTFALRVTAQPAGAAPDVQQAAAQEAYDAFAGAFLASDWAHLDDNRHLIRRHTRFLTPEQRRDVAYITQTYDQFRPAWWKGAMSVSSTRFAAETWGRKFVTHYEPGKGLGFQRVVAKGEYVQLRDGSIVPRITGIEVRVTWQPGLVGDPKPATGPLADRMGYARGDIGEVIVWHELGHNYITLQLTLEQLIELYTSHELLFGHLQEFYADLTALYHASPRARRAALQIRLEGLDAYDDDEAHTRAAHAIGTLLVHDMLMNPDDWPSVCFPPAVPEQQVELNTIIYVYEHWRRDWTVAEARRMRELVGDYIRRQGDRTFRSKGTVTLPSGTVFKLMIAEDHAEQQKRDRWYAQQLEKLIAAGRAEVLAEGQTYEPRIRREYRDDEKDTKADAGPRIDVPW